MTSQAYQRNDDIKNSIKASINLVDFIQGKYGVDLKKSGANTFKGLCPFHNEKSPSFTVYGNTNTWKCYGCTNGGDILKFVMLKEGWDFPTAINELTKYQPLTNSKPVNKPQPVKVSEKKPFRTFTPISARPSNLSQWQAYNDKIESYMVNGYELTIGRLPYNHDRCEHDRLLVPLAVNGVIQGWRGRIINCGCETNWLPSSGYRQDFIFNGGVILNKFLGTPNEHELGAVKERLGLGDTIFTGHGAIETVYIIENLVDAILFQANRRGGVGVVATGGITPDTWVFRNLAMACKLAGVKRVIVMWDRPSDKNNDNTETAWGRARDGLSGHGFDVVRLEWEGVEGDYKDVGEWLKATKPQRPHCDHNDIAIVDGAHGVYVQCKVCQASWATLDGVL